MGRDPDYFVQFSDRDVRGVPQGYRGVAVEQLGWKWAHCVLTGTGKRFKVRRSIWDSMTKHPVKIENSPN